MTVENADMGDPLLEPVDLSSHKTTAANPEQGRVSFFPDPR
jgi:hypothetical protein